MAHKLKTKEDYFADIKRRQKPVNAEARRREDIEYEYHNGLVAKLLAEYSQQGRNEVNKYIAEWNDVVMNENIPFKKSVSVKDE